MATTPEETTEQKLERLITENKQLQEANTTFAADNNKLKDENVILQDAKDILQTESTDLKEQYEHLQVEFTNEVTELSTQLAKSKVISDEAMPIITVDGQDYLFLGKKFIHQHKEYTLQSLRQDEALQRALINKGVGFLNKVDAAALMSITV